MKNQLDKIKKECYNIPVMNTKSYLVEVYHLRITEIDYIEGDTDNVSDGTIVHSEFIVNDIANIVPRICNQYQVNRDDIDFDKASRNNCYYASWRVNHNEVPPTKEEIEEWKNGEYNLFTAEMYFSITEMRPVTDFLG